MAESAVISTFFELRDRMSAGLVRIGTGLVNVSREATSADSKLAMLSSTASKITLGLGGIGAAFGGVALVKDVIRLNEEFENTGLRIAGALRAFDLAPTIGIAEKQAAKAMVTIQNMAAALPGETGEYISVFATALPKAIAAGMRNTQEIAKFTSSWMALASSNMVDAQQAGMDLFRLLSGQAGADVRMFTVLAEKIGVSAEEYNKLVKKDPTKSVVMLQKALAAYADQQASAATKFSAKLGEFQSRIKEIKRLAGAAIFEKSKTALEEINAYLEQNRYTLVRIGREVLDTITEGFKLAGKAVKFIAENLDTVIKLSTVLGGIWITGTIAGSVLNLINLFTAMTAAAKAAQVASAATATTSALGAALAMGGKQAVLGGALAGAGGGAGTFVVGNVGKMILGAGAAAALGGALAFLMPSAGAGTRELDWERQRREQQDAELELRKKYNTTIRQVESKISGVPESLMDVPTAYRDVYKDLTKQMAGPLSYAERARISQERTSLIEYAVERDVDVSEILPAPKIKPIAAPADRNKQVFDFRNSRFDIKQQFAEGFDPDRIAVAFAQDIARVGEMRLQSNYTQTGSVR